MITIINKNKKIDILYRVKEDDTINGICEKFNISLYNLKMNNPYYIDLYPGCILYINNCVKKKYVVQPMDTISTISNKINLPIDKLKEIINNEMLFIGKLIEY